MSEAWFRHPTGDDDPRRGALGQAADFDTDLASQRIGADASPGPTGTNEPLASVPSRDPGRPIASARASDALDRAHGLPDDAGEDATPVVPPPDAPDRTRDLRDDAGQHATPAPSRAAAHVATAAPRDADAAAVQPQATSSVAAKRGSPATAAPSLRMAPAIGEEAAHAAIAALTGLTDARGKARAASVPALTATLPAPGTASPLAERLAARMSDWAGGATLEPAPQLATRAMPSTPRLATPCVDEPRATEATSETQASAPESSKAQAEEPAPPLRWHAEWSEQGVRLWLGADASAGLDVAQLTHEMQQWLGEQGVRLISLVCNGRTLYRASPSSPASPASGRSATLDLVNYFYPQEP